MLATPRGTIRMRRRRISELIDVTRRPIRYWRDMEPGHDRELAR
jgi:hypothetical protein